LIGSSPEQSDPAKLSKEKDGEKFASDYDGKEGGVEIKSPKNRKTGRRQTGGAKKERKKA